VKEIFKAFDEAGYKTQLFLLNSAQMGVPQQRQRTFFISQRKESFKPLKISLRSDFISVEDVFRTLPIDNSKKKMSDRMFSFWKKCELGKNFQGLAYNKQSLFNHVKIHPKKPCATITAKCNLYHYDVPRNLNDLEIAAIQTFPTDYDYLDQKVAYVCGMSVPPKMMQSVANDIYNQLLK
jgi:DNA (cytosine-5)-methyltransferase 1